MRGTPSNNDLISDEDIKAMLRVCDNNRNKAFIKILYETGARISEISTMKVSDVQFDKFGAILDVDGKTRQRKKGLLKA